MHYRDIYRKHYGQIPVDENGRSFDIHHVDGRRKNNDPNNLVALRIDDHYMVHWDKGDWAACQRIAARMGKSHEELSELATLANLKHVADGTHPWLGKELHRKWALARSAAGTHPFQTSDVPRQRTLERIANGEHPFLDIEWAKARTQKQLEDGKHPWQNSEMQRANGCKGGKKGGATTGKMPWWTNGVARTRAYVCPGDEWRRGRK